MPTYHDIYQQCIIFSGVADFTSPGSSSWTVPSGVTLATFEIWGAGGGGGSVCCCMCYQGGPGGSGGGYSRNTIAVTAGLTYSICVGAGGMTATVGNCTLHSCCYGQPGGTTYVTGAGLTNFCAVGGTGGHADCFYYCGCSQPGGSAYGGTINSQGGSGTGGSVSSTCQLFFSTGGAPGGFSSGVALYNSDNCRMACATGTVGVYPGGGGSTNFSNQCCCCGQAGVGANGLVRISY